MSRRTTFTTALLAGSAIALPALAQAQDRPTRQITPYIEVGQVLTADLSNGGDVLTYSSVAAGIDASLQSRRTQVQVSYRYEHRFSWDDNQPDDDVHSGLARAAIQLTPALTIEGGALATRARSDIRGAAPGSFAGYASNLSQLYSAYVGPTLATNVGPASLSAGYRFGYTKVESSTPTGVPAGAQPLDYYDRSTSHLATASIGVRPNTVAPIGVTLSGAWQREDANQLDQRYEGKFARLDAVLPVTASLAVVGGVGYEKIELSQRDPLLTAAGVPVTDSAGRYVTNGTSPRRIAYDTDGLFWDAGVMWRPSPRTTVQGRVGRRYDSMIYTGSISYAMSEGSGLQVGVYDAVQSFGRGIGNALATLPTSFNTQPDPFGNQFGGCVFGTSGQAVGQCLNPTLGSITTANFRARGVDAVYVANAGPYRFGIGGGYANRRYLVPLNGFQSPLAGVTDETYYAQVFLGRALTPRSSIVANVYANYFDTGIVGAPDVFGAGANGSYTYNFGRFGATATAGIFTSDQGVAGKDTTAQGALGMRYSF